MSLLVQSNFKKLVISLIIAFIFVTNVTSTLASTLTSEDNGKVESPPLNQNKADEEPSSDDTDDILGVGKTIFIVICAVAGLVLLGILISICFCCACLCFSGRKRKNHQPPPPMHTQPQAQVGVTSNYTGVYQQQQPSYGGYNNRQPEHHPANNGPPYGNNYDSYDTPVVQQSYLQSQQSSQYINSSYQKSASPPRGDPYSNSIDQNSVKSGDPNLIVNRFKPTVPPKPKGIPGWTAVTAEVKKRTQLAMERQNQYDGYSNDGYDGDEYDGDSQITSPVPSQPNHSQKSTNDNNFMY